MLGVLHNQPVCCHGLAGVVIANTQHTNPKRQRSDSLHMKAKTAQWTILLDTTKSGKFSTTPSGLPFREEHRGLTTLAQLHTGINS